jgi:hypothetical protein
VPMRTIPGRAVGLVEEPEKEPEKTAARPRETWTAPGPDENERLPPLSDDVERGLIDFFNARPTMTFLEREPEEQLMMAETFAPPGGTSDSAPPRSPFHAFATLLRQALDPRGSRPFALRHHAAPPMLRRNVAPGPSGGSGAPQYAVLLTSLGGSTGGVLEMQIVNGSGRPIPADGFRFVIEPLKKAAQDEVRQEFQRQARALVGRLPAPVKLNVYCLELLRRPPTPGTVFRVAAPELQRQYAPFRRVLAASRALDRAGALRPDMNPREYFHSIRQWAVWTKEQGFTRETFAAAFVEHTRKSLLAAGRPWNKQVEDLLRRAVPGRWEDIDHILAEAAKEGS